jgi:predicted RNA-binding protein with PUA-like domain
MPKKHWLMKSEPSTYSIADLKRDQQTEWDGVRNYQARNFMRDDMKVGDLVLFYHSVTDPVGVAGVAEVVQASHPDVTQFDHKSKYFEPRATQEKPVWYLVDIAFVEQFPRIVPLAELRSVPALAQMELLRKGSRLSVQPVTAAEFQAVLKLARR